MITNLHYSSLFIYKKKSFKTKSSIIQLKISLFYRMIFSLKKFYIFLIGIIIGVILANLRNSKQVSELRLSKVDKADFFLVSILTSNKFIDTRVKAINETWAKNQNNVLYFTEAKHIKTSLPVIFLPNTDDSYPPQKKSFKMLKFLYDNYLNSFEWFIRADDDVYIKLDRLKQFLKQLDSKKAFYIGQSGFDHSPFMPYCVGGPGVILSKETLKRIGPYLNYCYQNLIQTEHEDVEIGRCIHKFANISCSSSHEVIY